MYTFIPLPAIHSIQSKMANVQTGKSKKHIPINCTKIVSHKSIMRVFFHRIHGTGIFAYIYHQKSAIHGLLLNIPPPKKNMDPEAMGVFRDVFVTSPKFNIAPEKMMVGRWVSFWGPAYF